jgi:SAM-dependent methyltransferase
VYVNPRQHWQEAYLDREPTQVSWFEEVPVVSREMIAEAGLEPDAAILDAGGGASRLAGELLRRGFADVTVADISAEALRRARAELGADGARVKWVEADLRMHDFGRRYDLWHDRAVLQFMVADADRAAYLDCLRRSVAVDGQVVLAGFGPDGPTHCSGLEVRRYGAGDLAALLGDEFRLAAARLVVHHTPGGAEQQFQYARLRRG